MERVNKKGTRRFTLMIVVASLVIGIFFIVKSCTSNISPDVANLALDKNGSIFLFSPLGNNVVSSSLESGQSPAASAFVRVYKDDDEFYVEPGSMKEIVDVFSNNYILHPYEEKSYEGYVTSSDTSDAFSISTSFESTEKVGEQLTIFSVPLRHDEKRDEMIVRWSFNPKSGVYKARENCEVHSFWFQTNPSPGETVISAEDFLVINLNKLAKFYNKSFRYDADEQVLYIID